jgi:TRAP-type transport system periplasmic protein
MLLQPSRSSYLLQVLLLSSTSLVLAIGGCNESTNQSPRFKLGHVYEARSPTHRFGSSLLNQRLSEIPSDLQITVFPASQLGNESELVEQLVAGELELVIAGPSFLAMWHPPLGIFDAAFAFRDMDHMMQVAKSEMLADHWELLRQKFGVRILDTWAYGTRHITSNHPIRSLADLSGFRLRFPSAQIWQASGRAMGASPMPIPFADVYLALQTGTADGQENPISVIKAMGFQEVQKYLCLTGHIQSATVVMVNDRAWNSLTEQQRQALSRTIKQLGEEVYQNTVREDQEVLQQWEADQTLTVIRDVDIEPIKRRCLETFSQGYPFSDMYRQTTGQQTSSLEKP